MDFNFNDEQEQLRDAVSRWVARSYSFERRRDIVAQGGFFRGHMGRVGRAGADCIGGERISWWHGHGAN